MLRRGLQCCLPSLSGPTVDCVPSALRILTLHADARQRHFSSAPKPHTIVQDEKNSRRKKRAFEVSGSARHGFRLTAKTLGGAAGFSAEDSSSLTEYCSRRVTGFLRATFLPSGYPTTVGPGYLPFVLWQSVANFCVAASAVISSTFLLYSVGLGAGAIPTAGAMNWVLKDGLGQLGTLLFGKAIAHNFDIHSKSWFFLSMVKLNVATGLEIFTILMPQHFLLLGSLANSMKGLAFMANGSTRSVFNLSFARDNNIADITAKGTSQYICASMFGTVTGASVCGLIGQDTKLALGCFSLLATITMWSAFTTVKTIPLPTLNNTRLQLLCEAYLTAISTSAAQRMKQHRHTSTQPIVHPEWQDYKTADDMAGWEGNLPNRASAADDGSCPAGSAGSASELERMYDEYQHPHLPSPQSLAAEDPPLPWLMGDVRILNPAIIVGRPLDRILEKGEGALLMVLLSTFQFSRYLMVPCGSALNLILHHDAKPRDICQAYLQACLLRRRMRQDPSLGQAAALHACAVEQMKQRNEEAVRFGQASFSSNPSSSMSSNMSSSSSSSSSSSNSSGSSEGGSMGVDSRDWRSSESRGLIGMGSSSSSSDSSGSGERLQLNALDETGSELHEAGASLAATSDTQSDVVGVSWHKSYGIGNSCGNADPEFWVASTGASSTSLAELRIVLQDTLQTAERLTTPFMSALEYSGWQLGKIVVEANRRRARW